MELIKLQTEYERKQNQILDFIESKQIYLNEYFCSLFVLLLLIYFPLYYYPENK